MKAVFMNAHGGPEVLQLGELPDPEPQAGEVIVDIHAASVNGADWKVREGGSYSTVTDFPYILGRDFSGTVSKIGPDVEDIAVGDLVFGVCDVGQEGTYCEKIAMKSDLVAKKPDSLSHEDAAALALIGLTALVAIEDTLKFKSGETILIQGGAGGVAGFAIQLAKHIGAQVISTCSTANVDYVKGLGADIVIDYTKQDFSEVIADCDAVFETVGGEVANKSFAVLRPGGRMACIASGPKPLPSPRSDVTSLRPNVTRDRPHLERICELHAAGAVTVPEIRLFALENAVEAHRISQGRHLRGKLVFKIA